MNCSYIIPFHFYVNPFPKNKYDKKTKKTKVTRFPDLGLTSVYTPEFCEYVLTLFEKCIATVELPNVADVRISDYIRDFTNIGLQCDLDESSIMLLTCNFNLEAFLKGTQSPLQHLPPEQTKCERAGQMGTQKSEAIHIGPLPVRCYTSAVVQGRKKPSESSNKLCRSPSRIH